MNILPKKSWHVRTKANIERVRRDEAAAAKEEKERQRRILLAEQEARTEELRRKNRPSRVVDDSPPKLGAPAEDHPNFFVEDSVVSKGIVTNVEHEAEKKSEQEKWEKSVGILTGLGQSSLEANGSKPWYLSAPGERFQENEERESRGQKNKLFADPLVEMQKFLKKAKVPEKETKKRPPSSMPSITSNSGKKSLETLRKERLRREEKERERAKVFLGLVKTPTQQVPNPNDRQRRYNSQFNPHLARQNIPSERK